MIYIPDSYRRFFDRLFSISLCILAFGIPTSNILMSLAQFGFGLAVFAVPDYLTKIKRLLGNPAALSWIGFYVLFLLGGLASSDMNYFLKDIRTKMPVWVLPAALALMPPLSVKERNLVLHFFLAGCLTASFAGLIPLIEDPAVDRRALSPLVSHIRLSIYLVFSLFLVILFYRESSLLPRWLYVIAGVFLLLWLFFLKSFTGVVIFLVLFPLLTAFFFSKRWNRWLRLGFVLSFIGLAGYVLFTVRSFYRVHEEPYDSLPKYTREGNEYLHDTALTATENGYYIWRYLQFDELKREWEKRSELPFEGLDRKGNVLKATLCRYLASKNLPRDAEGISALRDEEIRQIENGVPNYLYAGKFNIKGRIYEILWEWDVYRGTGDPNGKSLSTRVELWKASALAIAHSPVSGYGTGDVRHALKNALRARKSRLLYYGQFGPHNQFLSVWLALGVAGFLWFIFCIAQPLFRRNNRPRWIIWAAAGILILASLNEDIFETQASVTFFAFMFHILQPSGPSGEL